MKKQILIAFLTVVIFSCTDNDYDIEDSNSEIPIQEETPEFLQQAYPDVEGEFVKIIPSKGEEVNLRKVGDEYVWQGDIVLSEDQVQDLFNNSNSESGRTAISTLSKHWPKGIVYFTLNAGLPTQTRNNINGAIAHWRAQAPYMSFVARTIQTSYIEFVSGSGCSSALGKTGGRQIITLSTGCGQGAAIHEIGHALGLLHEQTRTDRNNSIVVNYSNIRPEKRDQFDIYTTKGIDGFQIPIFDFNSIMLYPPRITDPTFVYNININTMTRLDGTAWNPNTTILSAGDLQIIELLYGGLFAVIEYTTTYTSPPDRYYKKVRKDAFVSFFTNRNLTTRANLNRNITFNYRILGHTSSSQIFSINLAAGQNRYFLTNFVSEYKNDYDDERFDPDYTQNVSTSPGLNYVD